MFAGNYWGKPAVDLKDIKAIIDLMKKNSVSEFELEKQDFKIRLKRGPSNGGGTSVSYEDAPVLTYVPPTVAVAPGVAAAAAPAVPAASPELEIKSPMIGTFYRS